jgi:hypothetical protein
MGVFTLLITTSLSVGRLETAFVLSQIFEPRFVHEVTSLNPVITGFALADP